MFRCIFLLFVLSYFQLGWGREHEKPVDFTHGRLMISENHRFLMHEDHTPFFYLGDTAWELFHRLNREEAVEYLEDRAKKGFTVIQAVALSEVDGYKVPNAYGHLPLCDYDPSRPCVKEGTDNDYWDHVDFIVDKANELGMFVGLLPTWGRYWHDNFSENGNKSLFTVENAEKYGEFIGQRYKDKHVIWILGGDRNIQSETQKNVIRAMAKGIRKWCGDRQLISFHPTGQSGSSQWFHNDEWLDFNMRQNGHTVDYTDVYSKTLDDYNLLPVKPVVDGEPLYEDHPISFNPQKLGHSVSADIRRTMYWDLFNGACGYTYGHHSIWQMYDTKKGRNPINNPLMTWKEALDQPGASQVVYGKKLIESRPFFSRIPDSSIIVTDKVATSVPGEGRYRFVATRDEEGTYAMIYVPVGRAFKVNLNVIKGEKIKAWWYNPRNGRATKIGTFVNDKKEREFVPPAKGELLDWVLVLDDAEYRYPKPGLD